MRQRPERKLSTPDLELFQKQTVILLQSELCHSCQPDLHNVNVSSVVGAKWGESIILNSVVELIANEPLL